MQETLIDLPHGRLAVQSYGGSGRDVLFLHSIGFCGPQWRFVADALTDRCRTFSMDLPGHAHSTLPMTEPADQWRHLPTVVEKLGLEHPVLVGHDSAVWAATTAALHHPELFSALVLVGGSMQRYRDASDLVTDPAFQAMLVERFHLGVTGADEASLRELKEQMAADAPRDSVMNGLESGLYEEAEHSTISGPDGTWLHTPTVAAVVNGTHFAEGAPDQPDRSLYAGLTVPTWFVALTEGFDANLEPEWADVCGGNPFLQSRVLSTGQFPQYTDVAGVAEIVAEAAQV